jgi:hypothetical protein
MLFHYSLSALYLLKNQAEKILPQQIELQWHLHCIRLHSYCKSNAESVEQNKSDIIGYPDLSDRIALK